MASKPHNKANLTALGAEFLADLLLEAVKGDAARQRRVRMALSADVGPDTVAAHIRGGRGISDQVLSCSA